MVMGKRQVGRSGKQDFPNFNLYVNMQGIRRVSSYEVTGPPQTVLNSSPFSFSGYLCMHVHACVCVCVPIHVYGCVHVEVGGQLEGVSSFLPLCGSWNSS